MIVFAHLLNDRSGSTRVLRSVFDLVGNPNTDLLYVGGGAEGIFDDGGKSVVRYRYRRAGNRLFTLIYFVASQLDLFVRLLRDRRISRDAVVYVNTLMPFSAALYGWVTGRPVIYHLHELTVRPRVLGALLVGIARLTAHRLIYVSDAHRKLLPIDEDRAITIYNAVEISEKDNVSRSGPIRPFNVVMLAYNRDYKGIKEFISLANRMSRHTDVAYKLVLSDGIEDVRKETLTPNLTLYPPSACPAEHYVGAGLVVNLSRVDLVVETFGLTLLEAMAFGVPVIAPPVGGPAELVRDGQEGYLIDSRDQEALETAVERLAASPDMWQSMSDAARRRAAQFDPATFGDAIADTIGSVRRTRRSDPIVGANL